MSQSAHPPNSLSQSLQDEDIGLKVIGPFKRLLGKKVSNAKEWVRNCESLIQDFENPDQEPSEAEAKLMKEYVTKLLQHRNILQGIPRDVKDKLSEPAVLNSARRDEFADGIESHLETVEYRRTLSKVSSLLGMYEQEFASRNIPMDDITQAIPSSELTNDVQVSDGEGSRHGSSSGTPRTFTSTREVFLSGGTDNLDQDFSYRRELEQRVAELSVNDSQDPSRVSMPNEGAHDASNGFASPVETSKVVHRANSANLESTPTNNGQQGNQRVYSEQKVQLPQNKSQEPQNLYSSSQTEFQNTMTPEMIEAIQSTVQRIQLEKDIESQRKMNLMHLEIQELQKENHSMRLEREASKTQKVKYSEQRQHPTKPGNVDREPLPEQEEEPARLRFTSCSDPSEGEMDYDEQPSSQYESEDGHPAEQIEHQSRHRTSKKRITKTQAPRHHPRQVTLEDVKKNLISFNGTGRFDTFRTIFYDTVMENDGIKPFMKAVLLEQHLRGSASRYFYQLADPTKSIERTFRDLDKKYGRKANEMSLHDKFYSLPFHQTDSDQMVTDVADHRKVLAQLEEQDVNINDSRSIIAFTKKLPNALNEKVLRYLTVTQARKVTFDKVLDIIEKEIEVLHTSKAVFGEGRNQGANEIMEPLATTIHYANPQPYQNNYQYQQNIGKNTQGHQNPSQQNSRQRGNPIQPGNPTQRGNPIQPGNPTQKGYTNGKDSSTKMTQHPSQDPYAIGIPAPTWSLISWSFPFGTPEQGEQCVACDGPHKAIRCPLSSVAFRAKLQAKKLCDRCTLSGHKTAQCPKNYKCGYCQGAHCMGGCPLKEKYRNRANIPAFCVIKDENSPKKPFRKQGKSGKSSQ